MESLVLDLEDSKDLLEWLMNNGLSLKESAEVIAEMKYGVSLSFAIINIFRRRKETTGAIKDVYKVNNWGDPVTP